MKKIIFILLSSIALTSCFVANTDVFGKDKTVKITVYGNVSDAETGEPLSHAIIKDEYLQIGSTVTGGDGNYEFSFDTKKDMLATISLVAEKENYEPEYYDLLLNDMLIKLETVKVDFLLHKIKKK